MRAYGIRAISVLQLDRFEWRPCHSVCHLKSPLSVHFLTNWWQCFKIMKFEKFLFRMNEMSLTWKFLVMKMVMISATISINHLKSAQMRACIFSVFSWYVRGWTGLNDGPVVHLSSMITHDYTWIKEECSTRFNFNRWEKN